MNSDSNNDVNKKNLYEIAKVNISNSENENSKINFNQISNDIDIDKGQNKINSHLIYSKYDNKKINQKKKYVDSSDSDVSLLEKNNKREINRALIKKYEIKFEKLSNQISDLKRQLSEERQLNLDAQQELKYAKLEFEKMTKINNLELDKLNEKKITLEEQNKRLIIKNEDFQKKLDEYSPKIGKYDEINDKYQKINVEKKNLLETNKTLNELLNENKNKKNEIE